MTQSTGNPREYVNYEKMVTYVTAQLAPMTAHIDAHDAWHLLQVQNEQARTRADLRSNITSIIAAVSVIVAMVTVVWSHVH